MIFIPTLTYVYLPNFAFSSYWMLFKLQCVLFKLLTQNSSEVSLGDHEKWLFWGTSRHVILTVWLNNMWYLKNLSFTLSVTWADMTLTCECLPWSLGRGSDVSRAFRQRKSQIWWPNVLLSCSNLIEFRPAIQTEGKVTRTKIDYHTLFYIFLHIP